MPGITRWFLGCKDHSTVIPTTLMWLSFIFYEDTGTDQIIILLSVFCLLAHGPALWPTDGRIFLALITEKISAMFLLLLLFFFWGGGGEQRNEDAKKKNGVQMICIMLSAKYFSVLDLQDISIYIFFFELRIKALLIRSVRLDVCLVTSTACALLSLFIVLICCPSINKWLLLIYNHPM